MGEDITCPVCGIRKVYGQFYWSTTDKEGNFIKAGPDEVASKVCQIAKGAGRNIEGCINGQGRLDAALTWEGLNTTVSPEIVALLEQQAL